MILALLLGAAVATAADRQANLLIVTVDTLRADRVGAYGRVGAHTPAMDSLAKAGVLVEDAVVHVPQTRPSHASLFTGRLPYEHGLRDNFSPPLQPHFPTLAEVLKAHGYATAGFVGAYPVSRDSGLDRGYDEFDDPFGVSAKRESVVEEPERRGAEVTDRALVWLGGLKRRPFFAWVHLFDPHAPYDPPPPWRRRFAGNPYDGEVAYADQQVGRLLAWLDKAGERQSTLVVVTSDHGEGLGDHGEDEHLFFVYESTLRVPLLLRWPGKLPAGARVKGQFPGVDLMPTTLALLGVPSPATSGIGRAVELREGRRIPDSESYAESLYGQLHFGYAPLRALRAEGWKYIDAPRPELYDLRQDPGETRNRVGDRGQVAEAMRRRLPALDKADAPNAAAASAPEAAERLAALGYIGGAFFTGTPSGADPKDKIGEFQEYRRETTAALRLFARRDFSAAVNVLQRLARPVPTPDGQVRERRSFNVSFYLGRSLLELRRFREAIRPLQEALELSPKTASTYVHLARALAGAGSIEDGLVIAERGLSLAPNHSDLHHMRGRLLLRRGNEGGALAALSRARTLDPANALVAVDLANLHRNGGALDKALVQADAAVRLDPRSADARVAHGLVLGAQGRETLAVNDFKEALRLDPGHPDAMFYLAAVELRAGRPAQAVSYLERLLKKAPDYPGARQTLEIARKRLTHPRDRHPVQRPHR